MENGIKNLIVEVMPDNDDFSSFWKIKFPPGEVSQARVGKRRSLIIKILSRRMILLMVLPLDLMAF